jgi:LAO/AO transport system kinase
MAEHFNHPNVYIRSLATRGSLGGLSAKIFEVTDVMKHADFDVIIIETVGVGQSEVEIAGIADSTAVVLVPEAGDEVQTLKSGLMEIADIFVINKSDREGADIFVKNLSALVHGRGATDWQIPVLKTVATTRAGVPELWEALMAHNASIANSERSSQLMTEKAFQLIVMHKMKGISKEEIFNKIQTEANKNGFNLYQFLQDNYFN